MKRLLDVLLTAAILLFLGLIVTKLQEATGDTISGPAWVIDGDTLSIDGKRIRLSGLDAPELEQACLRDEVPWACGQEARDELRTMIAGGDVACTTSGTDRYGRRLATCVAGGRTMNAAIVEGGYAIAEGAYDAEEDRATAARRGIWAGSFDPPRQWRRMQGLADMDEEKWFERLVTRLRSWF